MIHLKSRSEWEITERFMAKEWLRKFVQADKRSGLSTGAVIFGTLGYLGGSCRPYLEGPMLGVCIGICQLASIPAGLLGLIGLLMGVWPFATKPKPFKYYLYCLIGILGGFAGIVGGM
jgi:hypothetical protein